MNLIFFVLFTACIVTAISEVNENRSNTFSNENSKKVSRDGRLLFHSYIQNPIVDIMLQSMSPSYVPKNSGDFFDFLRDSYPLPGGLKSPYTEYDFVIVGAGSAGSVLAKRLTDDHRTTVLLLEAGKPEMIITDVPAIAPFFQSTDYSWQYYMEPQPGVCRGMENERCFWPRGKAVGGSSVINYMIYTRGRPEEWDRIAAAGNYGWSYQEVLPYYMKSEKATLKGYDQKPFRNRDGELPVEFPSTRSYQDVLHYYMKSEKATLKGYDKSPYRNRDGDLPVEFVPVKTKLLKAFLEAGEVLGHPTMDYNAPDRLGFGPVQATVSGGRRQSAAKVFLHKHKKRQNLHILPESTATKVLIDPATRAAYGVEYVRNGKKYVVRVRKEVILSAGPIASPQLLMLSGIGPKENLAQVGIPLIKDLPVGQTLYDHICFPGAIFTLNETNLSLIENEIANLPSIIAWLHNGDNAIASLGGVEGIGYIKTPNSEEPESVPDIELISIGGSIVSDGGPRGSKSVRRGMRLKEREFNAAFGAIDATDTWSAFAMLLHPKSVGKLELKDGNPFSHPKMYGNYLTDPRDVASLVSSVRHMQALAATPPFQKYGATIHRADFPTCRGIPFDSDEYWECAIRTQTATLHHQISTCRMGPVGDPRAVVDPELRVHGVDKLRVVDSSVIPRTTSAHTNAPAIMIGEKAADMIRRDWAL